MVFGMWTDPAHRRRGHANAVLDVVVAWARERDLPISLHVNTANPGARAAYERSASSPPGTSRSCGPAPTSRSS